MNFTISEYTPDVTLPKYKQTDYSLTLEMAVLSKKNQEYQKALQTIQGLQQSSLNISMNNIEGRAKLDAYNKKLNEELSVDLGDLTKIETQNKIANLFQEIASDNELITVSKLSKDVQNEYDFVQRAKQSGKKDSGYNDINEYVWMNWDGGYYDFMKKPLSVVADPSWRSEKYTPWKDLRTPMANMTRLLHEDIIGRERQSVGPDGKPTGYLIKTTEGTGVSPERVRALYEEQFGVDGVSQVQVLAKYEILKTRQVGGLDQMYDRYKTWSDNQLSTQDFQKKQYTQLIDYNNALIKKQGTTDPEKLKLQEENKLYAQNLAIVENNYNNIKSTQKDKNEFTKLSNPELLPYIYGIEKDQKVKAAMNALSWKKDVQELKADTTYLALKKIDAMMAQTKMREDGANNRMILKAKLDREGKASENPYGPPADISKNKLDVLSSLDRLTELQESYAKRTDNILMAPSFSDDNLKEGNFKPFFDKNKDNYYVQMWDKFRMTGMAYDTSGNPNKVSFAKWLTDEESDPNSQLQGIIQQHKNDDFTASYFTKKLDEINGVMRSSTQSAQALLPYARDNQGNAVNQQDFNTGKEIFFYLPTSPKNPNESDQEFRTRGGTYMKKSMKDVLYDLENSKKEVTVPVGIPGIGLYQKTTFGLTVGEKPKTYLDNDSGFKQVLSNYQEKVNDPTLLGVLENKLPQIAQFKHRTTNDKDEIQRHAGEITSAAKNQSESFRTLFSADGIETIAIPNGYGTQGIVKFKDAYAKTLQEAHIQMPSADGNSMQLVEPGKAYLFETQPLNLRDEFMNQAIKEIPWESPYKGHYIKIESDLNGDKHVTITFPDGTTVQRSGGDEKTDVNAVIQATKLAIDALTKPK